MKFKEYGHEDGSLVIYFHGTPGAITECSLFEKHAKRHKLNIVCFDRFAIDAAIQGKAYYQELCTAIKDIAKGKSLAIIGFSIGCHVAIEVSNLLGAQVKALHLVSAAAPLESGDYLPEMAGGTVFKLAMNYPRLFCALSYWQLLLAKLSPKLLFSMLFSSAQAQDKLLSQQQDFKDYLIPILMSSYATHIHGYLRDVAHYVSPWQDALSTNTSNTYLWHGTEDNWSPIAMATYLASAMNSCMNDIEGASHYSCLFNAAEKICLQLGESS